MKLVLAYTTVASLGLMVLLLGVGADAALAGAALYLLAHALFKGGLFMVAGAVDHAAGSQDMGRVRALAPRMPVTFTAALLAVLSMAGLPPFMGFLAKEGMYHGLRHGAPAAAMVTVVAGNALMVAVAARLLLPFLRPGRGPGEDAGEAPPALWLGPLVLIVVRVMRGPTLADRIMALDLLVATIIGYISAYGILSGVALYVDIAIVLGLVGLLSTIALTRLVLGRGDPALGHTAHQDRHDG